MNLQKNHWIRKIIAIHSVIILVFLVCGCMGMKPGGSRSGKKLFETFFIGDEGTQYFIKPLAFERNGNEILKMDVTFRYKNVIKDSATINLSFTGPAIIKEADSVIISANNTSLLLKRPTYMFTEKTKKGFLNRFTVKAPLTDICKLFNSASWSPALYRQKTESTYNTPKETQKKIQKLNEQMFILF